MIYVGIDPGISGAIAAIDSDGIITFWDAPTAKMGGRTALIPILMVNILKAISEMGECHVALEKVHSLPRDGAVGSFSFGKGVGIWIGILTALGMPYDEITPQRWIGVMLDGMPKDKDSSRVRALQLYPQIANQLNLKKHHNRADALLLATYLMRLK